MNPASISANIMGSIVGGAIGDALGHPTQFLSIRDIHVQYGLLGVTDFEAPPYHPTGTFTGNTQMTLAVAKALNDTQGGRSGNIMIAMSKRFLEWEASLKSDMAYKANCLEGCKNLREGKPWYASGVLYSKGSGAAVRVAPISIIFKNDPQNLDEVAAAQALITHRNPTSQAAAIVVARLVAFALNHPDPAYFKAHAIDGVLQDLSPNAREMIAKLRQVSSVVNLPPDKAYQELGEGSTAEEVVAGALYAVLSTNDFRFAVLRAVNTSADSDAIGAIAGNIAGALYGFDGIPENWRTKVEKAQELIDTGKKLAALAVLPPVSQSLIHDPYWHQFPEIRRLLYDPQTSLDLFNRFIEGTLANANPLESHMEFFRLYQRLLNDSRLSLPVRLVLGTIYSLLTDPQFIRDNYTTELSLLSSPSRLSDEEILAFEERVKRKYPDWRKRIRTLEWAEEKIRKFNPAWMEELKKLRGLTEELVPLAWYEDYTQFIRSFREKILPYLEKFGWAPHLIEWYFVEHANFLTYHMVYFDKSVLPPD